MLIKAHHLIAAPFARLAARFASAKDGVAAVEFALIVPIMASLFIGAVELSQVVTVDRRVSQVGTTTGDLVARTDKDILATDITDIMKVGSWLMNPYDGTTLSTTVSVWTSGSTNPLVGQIKWSCTFDKNSPNATCTCPNTTVAIPAGLVSTLDSVVVAEVTYGYKPIIFDKFMAQAKTKVGGLYNMTDKIYMKPRGACPQLDRQNGQPKCGC